MSLYVYTRLAETLKFKLRVRSSLSVVVHRPRSPAAAPLSPTNRAQVRVTSRKLGPGFVAISDQSFSVAPLDRSDSAHHPQLPCIASSGSGSDLIESQDRQHLFVRHPPQGEGPREAQRPRLSDETCACIYMGGRS